MEVEVKGFEAGIDSRLVGAFCLGWVFVTAFNCVASSPFIRLFFGRLFSRAPSRPPSGDVLHEKHVSLETSSIFASIVSKDEHYTLRLLIFLCLASSSVTLFISLCSFPGGSGTACTFVIAWSQVSSHGAEIFGLTIILLELRRFGARFPETLFFGAVLLVGTGAVFIDLAFSRATLVPIPAPPLDITICFRSHFLPTSLTASLSFIVLEIYSAIRLWMLLAPRTRGGGKSPFGDVNCPRIAALLIMELLVMVPAAIRTTLLVEILTISAGSILVLIAFNLQGWGSWSPFTTPDPVSSSNGSRVTYPVVVEVVHDRSVSPSPPSPMPYHPFASQGLSSRYSTRRNTYSSIKTFDSNTTTKSAVVHYAKHAKHLYDMPGPDTMHAMQLRVETDVGYAQPRLLKIPNPPASEEAEKSSEVMNTSNFADKLVSGRRGSLGPINEERRISVKSVPEAASEPLAESKRRRVMSTLASRLEHNPLSNTAPLMPFPLHLTPPPVPRSERQSTISAMTLGSTESPSISASAEQFPMPPKLRLSRISAFGGLRRAPRHSGVTQSRWSATTTSSHSTHSSNPPAHPPPAPQASSPSTPSIPRPLPPPPVFRRAEND